MFSVKPILGLICFFILSGLTYAQTAFESPAEYYEDASARSANGDLDGAVIQLKNALQLDSSHTPSLILLGELSLDLGNPRQASLVLSEALLQGADVESASTLLIEAYLQADDFRGLIRNLPYDDAPRYIKPEILAANAQAQLELGRTNKAAPLISEALDLDPENVRAKRAQATLYLRRGQIAEAVASAKALAKQHPEDSGSWETLGSALQTTGQFEPSTEAYSKALELRPGNRNARLSLIGILAQLERNQEATLQVTQLRELSPNDPRGAYYEALLAARRGDSETEESALLEATQVFDGLAPEDIDGSMQLLMLAALSHSGLGNFSLASDYLERFLILSPEDPNALIFYATTLLALDKTTLAVQQLLRLNTRYPNNERILSLLAGAYQRQGDFNRATELLSSIESNGSNSLQMATSLGLSQLSSGHISAGVSNLEAVRDARPENTSILLPLALAYTRSNRWDEAESTLEALLEVEPDNYNARNLLGLSYLAQGNTDQAVEIWRAIADQAPQFLPAQINLAKYLRETGQVIEAESLLAQLSKAMPDSASVIHERALLASSTGDSTEALRLAERAVQIESGSVSYTRTLIDQLLAVGQSQEAEDEAQRISASGSDLFEGSVLYGNTLVRLQKPKQAALLYTQMARNADFNANQLLTIGRLQFEIGEYDSAILSLEQALRADATNFEARQLFVRAHLAAGKLDTAVQLADLLVTDSPNSAQAYLLKGETLLAMSKPLDAEKAFEAAVTNGALLPGTLGRFICLQRQGKLEESESMLLLALDEAPDALPLLAAYSDLLITFARWGEAESVLTRIIESTPESWAHLNNRAFVRQQIGSSLAEQDARAALVLAPNSATINDTLGWILVHDDRAAEALEFLRQATARDADNPSYRYHLGKALADLGREREAQSELYHALEDSSDWEGRDRAEALITKLRSDLN